MPLIFISTVLSLAQAAEAIRPKPSRAERIPLRIAFASFAELLLTIVRKRRGVKPGFSRQAAILNQTTKDWHSRSVTLSGARGLAVRFFAALRMTLLNGCIAKCTNVVQVDLVRKPEHPLGDDVKLDLARSEERRVG